jgi:peptidoglycan/xylan/chitin deacetylase (PgdA/CDA1 family)
MTSLLRYIFSGCSPAGRWAGLSILIFHRVPPAPDPLFPGEIDAHSFEQILVWLKSWLNILPLGEAVERLKRASLPSRAACVTFDDGYADNYTQALPILERHRIPATFFIATGFLDGGRMWNDTLIEAVRATTQEAIDLNSLGLGVVRTHSIEDKRNALQRIIPELKHRRPEARLRATSIVAEHCDASLPDNLMLTSAQLRSLHAAGMEIGAHTVSHPVLTICDDASARREIADSRAKLEALLGERIGLFAYPNGKLGLDYTQVHTKIVAELGFDAALSTNMGASRHGDDPFQLRRFTPWDRTRWRFGLRMARNLMHGRSG